MANPSLKAQIEAAKSALASDLAAPSLVTRATANDAQRTPIMARNDIATDVAVLAHQLTLAPTHSGNHSG